VVYERAARDRPVDLQRVDLGDGAEHDAEPAPRGELYQAIVVPELEAAGRGLDPRPDLPELDEVEPCACGGPRASLSGTSFVPGARPT
jgi:hypothetical protein